MELRAREFVFVLDSEFILVFDFAVPLVSSNLNENRFYERSSQSPINIGGVLSAGLSEILKDFVPLYLGLSVSVTHCMGEFGVAGPYRTVFTPLRLSYSNRSTI